MHQTSILDSLRLSIVVKLGHEILFVGILFLVVDAGAEDNVAAAESADDLHRDGQDGKDNALYQIDAGHSHHSGISSFVNVSFEVENVVHQVSNTVGDDERNSKS